MTKQEALKLAGIYPGGAKVLTTKLPAGVEIPKARKNKYGAKPKVYGGVRYDSTAEANYAEKLDDMSKAGLIMWWLGQPVFRLGCPENKYRADFLVVMAKGVYAVDVKGHETSKFKHDRRLWAAYGPCELWVVTGGGVEVIHGKRGES